MFGRCFKRFRKSIAAGLLISLLPMLCLPFLGSSSYNGAERHVEWLRGQLKSEINETVERAIVTALEHDTHNLELFLEAFVEAYLEEQGSDDGNVHIDEVLFEILHRHWKQLIVEGVVPYLSLKTLQARISYFRDRFASTQFIIQKNEVNGRLLHRWDHYVSSPASLLVSAITSLSIIPRGP